MSQIDPGLRADIMRKRMEDKNTLTGKGSLYVGTTPTSAEQIDADGTTYIIRQTAELAIPEVGKDNYMLITDSTTPTGWTFTNNQVGKYVVKESTDTISWADDNESIPTPAAINAQFQSISSGVVQINLNNQSFFFFSCIVNLSTMTRTASQIDSNAVTTAKIKDKNVTTAKINDESVTTDKISNGAVTENKLGDSAVTADKISAGAVTENKLGNSAVTTNKIKNGNVTNDKLASSGISASKITAGSLTISVIPVLDGTKIGSDAITTVKIKDGNVTNDKLASGIDASKITSGTFTPSVIPPITRDMLDISEHKYVHYACLKYGNTTSDYALVTWIDDKSYGNLTSLTEFLIQFNYGGPNQATTMLYPVSVVHGDIKILQGIWAFGSGDDPANYTLDIQQVSFYIENSMIKPRLTTYSVSHYYDMGSIQII